jgi:aspartate aminotransferase-like enzyme
MQRPLLMIPGPVEMSQVPRVLSAGTVWLRIPPRCAGCVGCGCNARHKSRGPQLCCDVRESVEECQVRHPRSRRVLEVVVKELLLHTTREVFLAPDGQPFVMAGSGALGWDMVACNCLEPGDEV